MTSASLCLPTALPIGKAGATLLADIKLWTTLQARAALAGMQLMKSEGRTTVVVLLDRDGDPHRVRRLEDLHALLNMDELERSMRKCVATDQEPEIGLRPQRATC